MTDLVQRLSTYGGNLGNEAAKHIVQLERENAELRKDAERYRFIRHPALSTKQTAQILTAIDGYCEEDLDTAIDEAMK